MDENFYEHIQRYVMLSNLRQGNKVNVILSPSLYYQNYQQCNHIMNHFEHIAL
ncbi:hypothetical protein RirG_058110 [Rhizophagus irregularis DAOM 197198w]|uniref:Uncharacterized protein n=1 Tax=Rhizophagus irregularis (strain DAOM 197198w) TaxID=1432141 RepID=A0A015JVX3_RHIIW|nr:hypothetical protein RirG_058110 [Rhizophagus irregularis DAOM 197198w]